MNYLGQLFVTLQLSSILVAIITYQKLKKMSDENYQALKGQIDQIQTSVTNIKGDITRIKDSLNPDGLTAAEVAQLKLDLAGVVTAADELDKENEPAADASQG